MSWTDAYSLRFSGFGPQQRRFLQGGRSLDHLHYWRAPDRSGDSPMMELLELDWANYLPEYILRKADLCSMAHGLELRAPMLDQVFFQTLLGLPESSRFTRPAKQLLAPALEPLRDLDVFGRKKRGFNPPLHPWLHGALAPRFDGLGERLAAASGHLISAPNVGRMAGAYRSGGESLAEGMLQLLILDESLLQLQALRNR
jgi:asparagine synthase (glutamine-hydrolysing)